MNGDRGGLRGIVADRGGRQVGLEHHEVQVGVRYSLPVVPVLTARFHTAA